MSFTINGTSGLTFPDATNQTTAATASIPAGAVTNFANASAPTGWTQVTTYNNYAMRIVSGTGAGTGGSVGFTTAFASQTPAGTIGATTLSTSQMPGHAHSIYGQSTSGINGVGSGASTAKGIAGDASNNTYGYYFTAPGNGAQYIQNTGGGGSHDHTFTGTAINLAVQYVDNILCQKN